MRAGRNRREVFGVLAAQIGDENRPGACLEQGCGGRETVRVSQLAGGFEHGTQLRPQFEVGRGDDRQRTLRLE